MWDVLLDAFIDTLKLVPLLLALHILIEVLEHNAIGKIRMSKALKGRLAPLIGSGVGLLPQCGFSVVAAKLYAKRHITLGTLLAVFVATSDEAIPILLASPSTAVKLLPLLGIKLVAALALGYGISLFTFKKDAARIRDFDEGETVLIKGCHSHVVGGEDAHEHSHGGLLAVNGQKEDKIAQAGGIEAACTAGEKNMTKAYGEKNLTKDAACAANDNSVLTVSRQGAGEGEILPEQGENNTKKTADEIGQKAAAKLKAKEGAERYLWHPLLHTLTVTAYVFIVNLILGIIIFFVTEQRLSEFMESARLLQPLFAALVGLIPNCASSVAITGLYAGGALGLGGAVAGLCVNAGLGMAVLFKENKNIKENLLIAALLLTFSVALGMAVELIGGLIL